VRAPVQDLPCSIGQGDQFKDEFLRISPNNRIPAMSTTRPPTAGRRSRYSSRRDHDLHREKAGKFYAQDLRGATR